MASSAVEIIGGSVLTTAPAVYYTGLANQGAQIAQFLLFNSDTVNAHLVNIWLAPSPATPTLKDQAYAVVIPAGATISAYAVLRLIVGSATTIQLQCDANGVVTVKASASIITN